MEMVLAKYIFLSVDYDIENTVVRVAYILPTVVCIFYTIEYSGK